MNENTFTIDKGVPVPPEKGKSRYPFAQMGVGDSFLIPGAETSAVISSSINHRKLRYGEKYRCAKDTGGLRVWRTA